MLSTDVNRRRKLPYGDNCQQSVDLQSMSEEQLPHLVPVMLQVLQQSLHLELQQVGRVFTQRFIQFGPNCRNRECKHGGCDEEKDLDHLRLLQVEALQAAAVEAEAVEGLRRHTFTVGQLDGAETRTELGHYLDGTTDGRSGHQIQN